MDAGKNRFAKYSTGIAGFITAVLMSFILFVGAAYIALYIDSNYYEREYIKYSVVEAMPVEITMSEVDGIMAVSNHMMDFLIHGDKPEDLQIAVTINGETRDFFTEREIAHMADVRNLFKYSINLFFLLSALVVIINIISWKTIYKIIPSDYLKNIGLGITSGTLFIIAAIGILTAVICSNFSTAFIKFHHIFFDNDLWLLDPFEDLMINMLPESFFADTALRIVLLYAVFMLLMLIFGIFLYKKTSNSSAQLAVSVRSDQAKRF